MNPFSVMRFPPVWLFMTEPGRREIDPGSLGLRPRMMIGVFMINFLLVVRLGKTLRKAHSNTGYFVQCFLWQGAAEAGGRYSLKASPGMTLVLRNESPKCERKGHCLEINRNLKLCLSTSQ